MVFLFEGAAVMRAILNQGPASILPAQVAEVAQVSLDQARDIQLRLMFAGFGKVRQLIYHRCQEAPVAAIPFAETPIVLPWRCPACGVVAQAAELGSEYELMLNGPQRNM